MHTFSLIPKRFFKPILFRVTHCLESIIIIAQFLIFSIRTGNSKYGWQIHLFFRRAFYVYVYLSTDQIDRTSIKTGSSGKKQPN